MICRGIVFTISSFSGFWIAFVRCPLIHSAIVTTIYLTFQSSPSANCLTSSNASSVRLFDSGTTTRLPGGSGPRDEAAGVDERG